METIPERKMDHQHPLLEGTSTSLPHNSPNISSPVPTTSVLPHSHHHHNQQGLSPLRRPLTTHTPLGSPIHSTRLRSSSVGSTPLGWTNHPYAHGPPIPVMSPYTTRSMPVSPVLPGASRTILHHPFLPHASSDNMVMVVDTNLAAASSTHLELPSNPPPEPSETQKAMEAASAKERARAKALEQDELGLNADELRSVLKRERQRTAKIAADLAALKSAAVQSQFEAEVLEEGRINGLMRRLDILQQEKGRIIVELEREEEMLTNTLQRKLTEVREEKAVLERQIEREKKAHMVLQSQLSDLRNTHLSVAEALEEQDEMEEED